LISLTSSIEFEGKFYIIISLYL